MLRNEGDISISKTNRDDDGRECRARIIEVFITFENDYHHPIRPLRRCSRSHGRLLAVIAIPRRRCRMPSRHHSFPDRPSHSPRSLAWEHCCSRRASCCCCFPANRFRCFYMYCRWRWRTCFHLRSHLPLRCCIDRIPQPLCRRSNLILRLLFHLSSWCAGCLPLFHSSRLSNFQNFHKHWSFVPLRRRRLFWDCRLERRLWCRRHWRSSRLGRRCRWRGYRPDRR